MTSTTSTSENSGPLILKTDTRGRICMPADRRKALLEEFEKSGLSGAKFAALAGIKYSTFANWAQQRRRREGQSSAAKPERKTESVSWLEAVVQESRSQLGPNCGSLILHLPGGVRAELASTREVSLA